jgi:hypothetical protein
MHRLFDFVQWLNETRFSMALREGDWSFAVIETVHILGLGFSVGTIVWVDLRLIGLAMRRERVTDVISGLEPWAMGGFVVMFLSGIMLLLAEPLKAYSRLAFRLKVVMLILAAMNVLVFHRGVYRTIAQWDEAEVLPWQAKVSGYLSLILWLGIIIAGRWTAYF